MKLFPALLLLAVAACQPIPQPFADDRPKPGAPILRLKDGPGVFVAPVEGAPEAAELMAEALRSAGTPASAAAGNRASWRVAGRQEGGAVGWRVFSPEGALVGEAADARRVVALIQDPPVKAIDPGKTVVAVPAVEGAPGDGGRSLARAMASALRQANFEVAEKEPGMAYAVAGRVAVEKPLGRQQHVVVIWELRRRDGEKLGEIRQENDVPSGSLDGPWGDVAWAVANAAAEAIVPLLERAAKS